MGSQIESGVELIVRLRKRPRLLELEPTLLPSGLGSTDTVEIVGEGRTGKTLLISQLLGSCILPPYHGTVQIGGCGATAVLLNTDHHFQSSRLRDLIQARLRSSSAVASGLDDETVNRIIRDSLRNLIIYDCYDSEQFWLTVRTLDDVFFSDGNIALLAVDGIAAYYWHERHVGNRACALDSYVGKSLRAIREHTSRFKVVTIYTRSGSKRAAPLTAETGTESVDHRVRLCRIVDGAIAKHEAFVERGHMRTSRERLNYTMSGTGITWEND